MKITTIRASAGRTFNHPREQYSNFRHGVAMTADVQDGEDAEHAIKELQAKVEKLAEDHKQHRLHSLEELRMMGQLSREVADLEQSIKRGQDRLEELRKNRPEAFRALPAGTSESASNEEVPYR